MSPKNFFQEKLQTSGDANCANKTAKEYVKSVQIENSLKSFILANLFLSYVQQPEIVLIVLTKASLKTSATQKYKKDEDSFC